MRRRPGYRWRTLAHRDGGASVEQRFKPAERVCFDELVVDDWLHIEQMDTRNWWMDLCGIRVSVYLPSNGKPSVLLELDDPERMGELRSYLPNALASRETQPEGDQHDDGD